MKVKIRDVLSIVIFFVLMYFAVLLVRPVYNDLLSRISDFTKGIVSKVEDVTSLKVSYKSLSPSILSAFYIKDVKLTDSEGTTVVKIDKVKLEYKLFKLLKGNLNEAFGTFLIDGVDIDIDAAIPVIKNLTSNDSKKGFDISLFKAELPLDFIVKNVSLSYQKGNFAADFNLKKVSAKYIQRKKQLDIALNAFAKISLNRKSYSGNLGINGTLFDTLENSTVTLVLSNLTDGTLSLNKLNLLVGFNDNVLTGTTVKNSFPLKFIAKYDISSQMADVNFVADDFSVESIFASTGRNSAVRNFINKIKNLKLTSDTTLTYYVLDKDLSYETNTSVKIPSSLLPNGGIVKVVASGDEKHIEMKELSLIGSNYDIRSNLDLTYKNISLSGWLEIPFLKFPNDVVLSTEVFFEPEQKGFSAYMPQVFIGEKSFTALELSIVPHNDSLDFSFEGYDYSHIESSEPGKISIDGSYLFASKYIQTALSLNSFYTESVFDMVSLFMAPDKKETVLNLSTKLGDIMFSGDAYASTDFSSLSFNVPYIILANTKQDNQVLMLSFDGNDQSVSFSQIDLIYGKNAFHASASVDRMSEKNDLFFSIDFNTDYIPYHFSGTFTDGLVRVFGDYDTEIEVNFNNKNNISGLVQFINFPIPVLGTSIISSLDVSFLYSKENGPDINLIRFELEEPGNKFSLKPHLIFSGNVTKYGARLNNITYSDVYSVLDGNADVVVNFFDDKFNSGRLNLILKNSLSDENVSVVANISNPDLLPFSIDALKKEFYIDSEVLINRLSLNRFTKLNSANNEITASLSMTGTIEHPRVVANVEKAAVMISGNVLTANAAFLMENRDISISDFNLKYKKINVNNVSGSFDLNSFSGEMTADFKADIADMFMHVPLKLEIYDSFKEQSKLFPSSFSLNISSDGIGGSFIQKKVAFSVSSLFSPTMISVISSDNIGAVGYYNRNDGDFIFSVESGNITKLKLDGNVEPESGKLNAKLSDVFIDAEKICSYFNIMDYIKVLDGTLGGDVSIVGTIFEPEFFGTMVLSNPDLMLPRVFAHHLFTDKIQILFSENEISVPEKIIKVKKKDEALASCKIYFDKWKPEHLEAWIKTEKNKRVPVNIKNNLISISGDANADLNLYLAERRLDITGTVLAEKAEFFASLTKALSNSDVLRNRLISINCNLDVSFGTHVRMNLDPLIRCIFVPNAKLQVQYDQLSNQIDLDGTLVLKSGDVSYLNRNFYIKEGEIKFSNNDEQLNPRITVRAETRERDSKGDNVNIILAAENQYLKSFSPNFSSVPAKSENEIRTLLGQIVVADSNSVGKFMLSAGDYALQSLIGRNVENTLRDFFNFDILSIRTNIIQNTLDVVTNSKETINLGNFLDNSTVYIGKYLGSSFYVDAMLNLQYDNRKIIENDNWINGFEFRPEFGFEIASPFMSLVKNNDVLWNFNFRLNLAPDINAMIQNQQFVPATTMSLSWRFSF